LCLGMVPTTTAGSHTRQVLRGKGVPSAMLMMTCVVYRKAVTVWKERISPRHDCRETGWDALTMAENTEINVTVVRRFLSPEFKRTDRAFPSPLIETESEEPQGHGGVGNEQFPTSEAPQKGAPEREPVAVVMKEREICPNCGLGIDFPKDILIDGKPVRVCMDCEEEFKKDGYVEQDEPPAWTICQMSVLLKRRSCERNCPRLLGKGGEESIFLLGGSSYWLTRNAIQQTPQVVAKQLSKTSRSRGG